MMNAIANGNDSMIRLLFSIHFLDEMALLFSLENLLTEEGMDSIGKDFKVQQYTHWVQCEKEKKQE
jgi:hypothetical protein